MTGISWMNRQLIKIMPEKGSFTAKDLSLEEAGIKISNLGLGSYLRTMRDEGLLDKVSRKYCRANGSRSGAIVNTWQLSERGRKFKGGI